MLLCFWNVGPYCSNPVPNPALCLAECLPHANPRRIEHHLLPGNNHNFTQICLLEGNTSLSRVTLFPLPFWAEKSQANVFTAFFLPAVVSLRVLHRQID